MDLSRYKTIEELAIALKTLLTLDDATFGGVIPLAVGWKIIAGTTTRFLQHSTAFQIDDYGNARGTAAVDLQQTQTAVTQVASGDYSLIGSGRDATASGDYAATLGGYQATASGAKSGVLGGDANTAAGSAAAAIAGFSNNAAEDNSVVMCGGAKTNNRFQVAHGQQLNVVGDAQVSRFPLSTRVDHGDANWYTVDLDNENGVVIPADTVMTFQALVAGITQGCAKTFNYMIVGSIKNDGGTTTLTDSTVTVINEDDASFDCRAQANDADDTLEIQVQDADGASDDVKWCARVVTAEVSFAA